MTRRIYRDAILWLGRKRRLAYSRGPEEVRQLLILPAWKDGAFLWAKGD
jgi:hypothetical protein